MVLGSSTLGWNTRTLPLKGPLQPTRSVFSPEIWLSQSCAKKIVSSIQHIIFSGMVFDFCLAILVKFILSSFLDVFSLNGKGPTNVFYMLCRTVTRLRSQ